MKVVSFQIVDSHGRTITIQGGSVEAHPNKPCLYLDGWSADLCIAFDRFTSAEYMAMRLLDLIEHTRYNNANADHREFVAMLQIIMEQTLKKL